ncbi:MAG: hypothetical protein V4622_09850 [Bacteroidota bacterium]
MTYRKEFNKIEALSNHQQRGTEFEILLNKICEDANISIFSRYRTADTSQEIDGCVLIYSKVFLLEAKWENEDTLAASKLYSFLGKINSKIEGTLGVFISYNKLKDNFINAFRNGIKQNCILIHGKENIEDIIDKKLDLKDFLEYCFIMTSTKNRIDISTSEFINLPDKSKYITRTEKPVQDNWLEIYNGLIGVMSVSDFTVKLEFWYSDKLNLSEKIINIYNSLNLTFGIQQKLDILITRLTEKEKDIFTSVIVDKFKNEHWKMFAYENFCNKLKELRLNIDVNDRKLIIENVTQVLNGDWDLENKASYVIDIFYALLSEVEKKEMLIKYLEIYCDKSRATKFKQKQFAEKLFTDFNGDYFDIVKIKLSQSIKELKLSASIYDENAE